MAAPIDKVPAEVRWTIATRGLTGSTAGGYAALKDAGGEEKYNEFLRGFWYQAGLGAKQFADSLGLTVENPKDMADAIELLTLTSMGPEFEWEAVETTEDRCVQKATKCPWHERWKELGLDFDYCGSGHQAWCDGVCESLNPNFALSLTKSMLRGDSHCEHVIERKK
jgi:hypothetical protein